MNYPWWYVFYNFLLWILAFFYSYNKMQKYPYGRSWVFSERIGSVFPVIFFVFLFILATFTGGDDETYREFVVSGYQGYGYVDYLPIERVYAWIASFVNGNFLLWRIIVYGSALALSIVAMSRLKCLNYVTLLAFVILIMTSYGNARAVLAFAIFVFGFTFLDSGKWLMRVIGIAIVLSSVFFHDSMIIPIIMLPFAFFSPSKKRTIVLIFLIPIAIILLRELIESIFDNVLIMESEFGTKLETYTGEASEAGTGRSILVRLLIVVRYAVAFFLIYYSIKAERKLNLPRSISSIIRISAVLFFISILFLFIPITGAFFISTRYITMLPAFLYVTWPFYLNDSRVISKGKVKFLLLISLLNPLLFWFMKVYYQSAA